MSETPTPTSWLPQLQHGDEDAADRLWQQYITRVMNLARMKMQPHNLRQVDEEDIAVSAMYSFCSLARKRDTPIENSTELWKLLATVVKRKVNKQVDAHKTAKRGGGRQHGESVFMQPNPQADGDQPGAGIAMFPGGEPSPDVVAECTETIQHLLAIPDMEEIVRLKLDGWDNSEIAQRMNCSTRTVQRKLENVRKSLDGFNEKLHDEWTRME